MRAAESLETLLQTRAGRGLRDASRHELLDDGEIFLFMAHPGRVSGAVDRVDSGQRVATPELGALLRPQKVLIRLQDKDLPRPGGEVVLREPEALHEVDPEPVQVEQLCLRQARDEAV